MPSMQDEIAPYVSDSNSLFLANKIGDGDLFIHSQLLVNPSARTHKNTFLLTNMRSV